VSCIEIVGVTGKTFLIDATPDLPFQLDALSRATGGSCGCADAIAITHAHVGHYLGLAFLGKEAMHCTQVPVYGTPSMARYSPNFCGSCHLYSRSF